MDIGTSKAAIVDVHAKTGFEDELVLAPDPEDLLFHESCWLHPSALSLGPPRLRLETFQGRANLVPQPISKKAAYLPGNRPPKV